MSHLLKITVRYLQPYSHARGERGDPEWPPSPLRLLQALMNGAAGVFNEKTSLERALESLEWLERLPAPEIACPRATPASQPYRLYVPDNVGDLVLASWAKGNENSIANYRAEKDVRPCRLSASSLHYLFRVDPLSDAVKGHVAVLVQIARGVTHLGWGLDSVVVQVELTKKVEDWEGADERWAPSLGSASGLRIPIAGSVADLVRKHQEFLGRMSGGIFRPVSPVTAYRVVGYRRQGEGVGQIYRVFELRRWDGSRFRYPARRLSHIAGMVRHLAIEVFRDSVPDGVDGEWLERFVAGHLKPEMDQGRFSYLPLPSIGRHADSGVRRVMITAPAFASKWLDELARRLHGRPLKPRVGNEFNGIDPPHLISIRPDRVVGRYVEASSSWASFTPVILPGHDDRSRIKRERLIRKALWQAGVEQACDFEWSTSSLIPRGLSSLDETQSRGLPGFIRPNHLLGKTALNLRLDFHDGTLEKNAVEVPGPLSIGSGRFAGLGLMVGVSESIRRVASHSSDALMEQEELEESVDEGEENVS